MEILLMLIPLSVVLVFIIGIAFWWAVEHGQFDQFEEAAQSILLDEDRTHLVDASGKAVAAAGSVDS